MLSARTLAALSLLFALAVSAQTADPSQTPVVRVFHPTPPLPSYEVATIKPFDASLLNRPGAFISKDTVRDLVREAYAFGSGRLLSSQVVGGPLWADKDEYTITSKPPADMALAMQKMNVAEKFQLDHAMQQSLLADRFHLKVHFEVREMPVYALMPAKGGLKLKPVAAPPPRDPANPPPPPAMHGPLAPGALIMGNSSKDTMFVRAGAITMDRFITLLTTNLNQTGDRPIIDHTGFTGHFDVDDFTWTPLESAATTPSDAPSLTTAIEQTLGLRLVLTKGPVEVVVIDSIDRPSEN